MQNHTVPSEVVGGSASVVFPPRSPEGEMLSVVISSWKRQLPVNVATEKVGVAPVAYLLYSLPKSRLKLSTATIINQPPPRIDTTGDRFGDLKPSFMISQRAVREGASQAQRSWRRRPGVLARSMDSGIGRGFSRASRRIGG